MFTNHVLKMTIGSLGYYLVEWLWGLGKGSPVAPPPPLGQGRALGWPTTRLELPLHSLIHSVHSFKYSWTPSVYWPLPLAQNSV